MTAQAAVRGERLLQVHLVADDGVLHLLLGADVARHHLADELLLGTAIVAGEGLNATLSGARGALDGMLDGTPRPDVGPSESLPPVDNGGDPCAISPTSAVSSVAPKAAAPCPAASTS